MRIYLNDSALEREACGSLTVGQVIQDLQREVTSGGKVVTNIRIDGKPLENGFRRRRQFERAVDATSRLDVAIANPQSVVELMLNDVMQVCSTLPEQCESLALQFRLGEEARANNGLAEMLDKLSLLTKSASVFERWVLSNATTQLSQSVADLAPVIDTILKAQTNGDYVALADALEYELKRSVRVCIDAMNPLKAAQVRSTPLLD